MKENYFRKHIPEEWQARLGAFRITKEPVANDTELPLVSASDAGLSLALRDFNRLSKMWMPTGGEILICPGYHDVEPSNVLASSISQLHRHSPCLPGALAVDPMVRRLVRENHLKASETAIWLLIIAVREYVQSVLKDTMTNLAAVDSEQALGPIVFTPCAISSGKMGELEADVYYNKEDKDDSQKKVAAIETNIPTKENAVVEVKPSAREKKRRITSLDIASALNGRRMSARSLAGSVPSLAYERCCHASFIGNLPSPPQALDSLKAFIVDSIESAAKKPKHERRDPGPIAIAPTVTVEPGIPKPKKASPRDTSGGSNHMPTGGLGKEAKNLAELKTRAATAAEAESTPFDGAMTVSQLDSTIGIQPSVPSTMLATGEHLEQNASPANSGVRASQSISPRGRGIGIKNLAVMRARTASSEIGTSAYTPPPKQASIASPNLPQQQQGSETNAASGGYSTPVSTKQNGKEVNRLHDIQGRKVEESNIDSAVAEATTEAGMMPAVPEAMDTSQ